MPLIKAGDGLIEARVGDVVDMLPYDGVRTAITENDLQFDDELCRCDEDRAFNALWSECKLVKRPFMVWDEVEYLDIGGQASYWIDHAPLNDFDIRHMEIDDGLPFEKLYKGRHYRDMFRHKNPAWRGE